MYSKDIILKYSNGLDFNTIGYVLMFPISFLLSDILTNNRYKMFSYFLLIIMIFALFLTFSRAAWLATAISVTVIFLHFKKSRYFLLILIILFIGITIYFQDIIFIILRLDQGVTHRDILWSTSIRIIKDNPIFGIGPNALKYYILQYSGLLPNTVLGELVSFVGNDAHNLFLTNGAETGIIGMIIVFLVFPFYYYYYFKAIKKTTIKYFNNLLIACNGIVIGAFVRSFFEGGGVMKKGYDVPNIFFWLVFIITIRLGMINSKETNV